MRKIIVYVCLFALLLPLTVFTERVAAAGEPTIDETIELNNYFAARVSSPRSQRFFDNSYRDVLMGDYWNNDGVILGYRIEATGMGSGDKVTIEYEDGTKQNAVIGAYTPISTYTRTAIITLEKVSSSQTYAKLNYIIVDDIDSGKTIKYIYTADRTEESEEPVIYPIVDANYYYAPFKDEYRVDYMTPNGTARYELYFESFSGTPYTAEYTNPTGVHWLTCNGYYWLKFYDEDGNIVAKSDKMTTTEIVHPSCNSYSEGNNGANELNGNKTNVNGETVVTWQPHPDAVEYEVWVDGELVETTTDTTVTLPNDGSVTVVAKDENGNVVAQDDLVVDSGGGNGEGGGEGCDACQWLKDMLACPAWDQYMGDLTDAIKDAIPPPPDWQQVANIMRDTIVPAMGDELVARAPEIAEIIADEFQSREKPVAPPPSPPPKYTPPSPLPQLPDLPTKIDTDLSSNTPSFEPDFSGSDGFVIEDPLDMELSDEDGGYTYTPPAEDDKPYNQTEQANEPDKEYNFNWYNVPESNMPDYNPKPDTSAPAPTYKPSDSAGSSPPTYQTNDSSGGIPSYETNESDEMPKYGGAAP